MEEPRRSADSLGFPNTGPVRAPAADSQLLLVDAQARLVPAIHDRETVVAALLRLLRAARLLDVPVRATEHCPEAIGGTVEALADRLPAGAVLAKRHFDATAEPGIAEAVAGLGRPAVVLAGVEAHVCVAQTALGLLRLGYPVFLVEDACGSRHPADREAGLARLRAAGCVPVTVEAMIFEWLGSADHPAFREALAIVKEA